MKHVMLLYIEEQLVATVQHSFSYNKKVYNLRNVTLCVLLDDTSLSNMCK